MLRRLLALILLSVAPAFAQAPEGNPYNALRRSTGSSLGERDPLGFPLRVHVMLQSPYSMWCSAPELFFTWAKASAGEFLNDKEAIIPCHGNPLPSTISSYVPAGAFGKLAVGMIRFDDAAAIPFQLELLQGLITHRLLAQQNGIALDDAQLDQLLSTITDGYGAAAAADRDATSLLGEDPWIARLISSQSPYTDVLDRYTSVGQFRRSIDDTDGPRELLHPAMTEIGDSIAAALASAAANPASATEFRYSSREDFRAAVRDVARRFPLRQPFNPGTREYLVLLLRPLKNMEHDVILCVRQQIPSAAERAALIARQGGAPAQRVVRAGASSMSPPPFMLTAASLGPDSCTIELFDPWSTTLPEQEIKSAEALMHLAKIWATVTGCTHHQGTQDQAIARRLNPELRGRLKTLSGDYLKQHAADYERLASNSTARADAAAAKEALSASPP
jgi:hypothetical protein